jgi:hypothetical protein
MKTEQAPTELPPELSAVEAKLASFRPVADPVAQERTKTTVLLTSCELVRDGRFSLSREKLIETIVKSGEPEITLSLRQYTKTIRTHATLNGLLLGILAGVLIGIVGTILLVRVLLPITQPQPVMIERLGVRGEGLVFQELMKHEP